ncbi:MAG: hypothetical protein C0175_00520 [Caldisericum exile]|uniref:Ribbon-helix-helix protein CopG domain-containing protein n=1 Tax=Caldisericum exile TaxID=693075 RepID=A0A2J6X9P7_9BACT|nr:MAG: hypothetical protein C0175_00520 [Caldisericum exile]
MIYLYHKTTKKERKQMIKIDRKNGVKELSFRIPLSIFAKVKLLAEKEDKSRSYVITEALENFLKGKL